MKNLYLNRAKFGIISWLVFCFCFKNLLCADEQQPTNQQNTETQNLAAQEALKKEFDNFFYTIKVDIDKDNILINELKNNSQDPIVIQNIQKITDLKNIINNFAKKSPVFPGDLKYAEDLYSQYKYYLSQLPKIFLSEDKLKQIKDRRDQLNALKQSLEEKLNDPVLENMLKISSLENFDNKEEALSIVSYVNMIRDNIIFLERLFTPEDFDRFSPQIVRGIDKIQRLKELFTNYNKKIAQSSQPQSPPKENIQPTVNPMSTTSNENLPLKEKLQVPVSITTNIGTITKALKLASSDEIDVLQTRNKVVLQAGQIIVGPDDISLDTIFFIVPIVGKDYFALIAQTIEPTTGGLVYRPIVWNSNKQILTISDMMISKNENQKFIIQDTDDVAKLALVETAPNRFLMKKAGSLADGTDEQRATGYFGFNNTVVEETGLIFDRDTNKNSYDGIPADDAIVFNIRKLTIPSILNEIMPPDPSLLSSDSFKSLLAKVYQLYYISYYNNTENFPSDLAINLRTYLCDTNGNSKISVEKMVSFLNIKLRMSDTKSWFQKILDNLLKESGEETWGLRLTADAENALKLLKKVFILDATKEMINLQQKERAASLTDKLNAAKSNPNYDSFISLLKALASPSFWFEESPNQKDLVPNENKCLSTIDSLDAALIELETFLTNPKTFLTTVASADELSAYKDILEKAKILKGYLGVMISNLFPQLLLERAYQSFEIIDNPDQLVKSFGEKPSFEQTTLQAMSKRLLNPRVFKSKDSTDRTKDLEARIKTAGAKMVVIYNKLIAGLLMPLPTVPKAVITTAKATVMPKPSSNTTKSDTTKNTQQQSLSLNNNTMAESGFANIDKIAVAN